MRKLAPAGQSGLSTVSLSVTDLILTLRFLTSKLFFFTQLIQKMFIDISLTVVNVERPQELGWRKDRDSRADACKTICFYFLSQRKHLKMSPQSKWKLGLLILSLQN